MNKSDLDITKFYFVGCVDYAQHNFARIKPLLYSETGRCWDGLADRSWFPHEGLLFTAQTDLRYAQSGSLWIFRVAPNARGDAIDKDVFSAIQSKPAIELVVGMEPLETEALRRRVTEEGIQTAPAGKAGAAVPEIDDRWVILNELQRDEQGRCRPALSLNLKHLKVMIGTPEELCGLPTPSGHFVLPPIHPVSAESRNWLPPALFLETLAADLKRWIPYGPQRPKAQAAAQALRELAPQMLGLSALRADEAKVAMARAANLSEAAETITGAAKSILDLIVEQEPFKAEIERRRAAINVDLENEVLAAVEEKEGAARDRLLAEQASLRGNIEAASSRLQAVRAEIVSLEKEAVALRSARAHNVDSLDAQVDALLQRAATEPAQMLAEWLGVSGFVVARIGGVEEPAASPVIHEDLPEPADPGPAPRAVNAAELGPLLFAAGPALNAGPPRLLIIDAALRARELPVLMGPLAREFAEAWLAVAGGDSPFMVMTDPTILSINELTPHGPRGQTAPLRKAFLRARSRDETVIVLLDDLDPAAASFWLPELARCQRHPERYGFPSNLLFIALIEADARQMNLTSLRAGELFPLVFDDCDPPDVPPELPSAPFSLTRSLVGEAAGITSWGARVGALERALRVTFKASDAETIAASLSDFLRHSKSGGKPTWPQGSLAALLAKAAGQLSRDVGEQV